MLQNTRIKANFGARPFAYAEGRHHRNAADDFDLTQEIRETFGALPFNVGSDSDSEGPTAPSSTTSDGSRDVRTPPGPPCKTATVPKSLRGTAVDVLCVQILGKGGQVSFENRSKQIFLFRSVFFFFFTTCKLFVPSYALLAEYNVDVCARYKLLPCYDPMTTTGPDSRGAAADEDESEQEDAGKQLHPSTRVQSMTSGNFLP